MAVRLTTCGAVLCLIAALLPLAGTDAAASTVSEGAVVAFGDAIAAPSSALEDLVGIAPTSTGLGWWSTSSSGAVVAAGDAVDAGEVTGALNSPVVGMASVPTGAGYWLVAGDGGVFSFGTARFHGSTGAMRLSSP